MSPSDDDRDPPGNDDDAAPIPPEEDASPTPPDATPSPPEEENAKEQEDAVEHEAPPPATYAGRLRAEEGAPEAGETEDPRTGFTEEFDEIERELDAELAGLDEVAGASEEELGDDDLDELEPDEADLDDEEVDPEEIEELDADDLDPDDLDDDELEEDFEAEVDAGELEAEGAPGETVEAETVALADKAEAEEAALAGLRARAAKQDPVAGAPAAPPVEPAAPAPEPVAATATPEPAPDEEKKSGKPPRARRLCPRFATASLLVVASIAAATSISLLVYLTEIAEGLNDNDRLRSLQGDLENVEGGDPQTILIMGSDKRLHTKGDPGRSDTTMLLRVDPDKDRIALLSIPRDLRVNIPGVGVDKFNAAYAAGGPEKTLQVVKQLTGLPIHHVVNINFGGFAKAVDAIECVFVDIDRHYFNTNDDALSEGDAYAEIDIEAGYQQLCGDKALQYVRFRHDDNDLVRAARQQSFLREARQKVPPERLLEKKTEFVDIFTEYTTSDIDDPIAIVETLRLFLALRDAPVRRIEFQGDIGDATSTYVTASNEQIKAAVAQFLGEQPAPADQPEEVGADDGDGDRGGSGGGGGGDDDGGAQDVLIDAGVDAKAYALDFDGSLRFAVYAPVRLVPGSQYSEDSRAYTIDTYDGEHYPSYKLVLSKQASFGVPEYYGVTGTKWTHAPILENPSETRTIGDRDYLLFYEGNQLQVVGWKTEEAAYWVSNTLTGSLGEDQMIAVAESMEPFSPER